jgi:CO/xanthine dehydrogenase Mo-binding subunit
MDPLRTAEGPPVFASTQRDTNTALGPYVNALGIKGVGEIGITGTAGALANAVWHATGIRVRKFPITLDRLIEPQ